MNGINIIFICAAIGNILIAIKRWIETDEEQFSAIGGWVCAIMYCLSANNYFL